MRQLKDDTTVNIERQNDETNFNNFAFDGVIASKKRFPVIAVDNTCNGETIK